MQRVFLFLIALTATFLLAQANSSAQKSVEFKGITLTPAIQNIELAPNQPRTTFKIRIENKQANAISLSASTLDFKSLNESGGVAFIGNNADSSQHKYGLANWLLIPQEVINLRPNTSKEVEIVIDNRADLSPGGHYAAILFKKASGGSNGSNNVSFDQVVATLVFMKKTGGEIYSLNLQDPKIKTSWFQLPSRLPLFIKNNGNTQTVPRGTVNIVGPNGKTYKKGIINADSGLVLPESTRFYRTPLFSTATSWLPGTYKAVITYRPDDQTETITKEYEFLYINLLPFLLIVALLIGAYLIRNYRSWK